MRRAARQCCGVCGVVGTLPRACVETVGIVEGVCMFVPGQSGNPAGRPKGSLGGRAKALLDLDDVLGREDNREFVRDALQKELRANPLRFFRDIVMPLLPREARLEVHRDGVVEWKSLLGDGPGESPRFDAEGRLLPESED